jgi:hypothetical protein
MIVPLMGERSPPISHLRPFPTREAFDAWVSAGRPNLYVAQARQEAQARAEAAQRTTEAHRYIDPAFAGMRLSTNIEDVRGAPHGRMDLSHLLQIPSPAMSGRFNPFTGAERYDPASGGADFSGHMDRALGFRSRRGNTGNIYAEVEFQREDDRTGGARGKDPFLKLKIDNIKQAPLADATSADYVSWAISG